jgi:hypothetical protein
MFWDDSHFYMPSDLSIWTRKTHKWKCCTSETKGEFWATCICLEWVLRPDWDNPKNKTIIPFFGCWKYIKIHIKQVNSTATYNLHLTIVNNASSTCKLTYISSTDMKSRRELNTRYPPLVLGAVPDRLIDVTRLSSVSPGEFHNLSKATADSFPVLPIQRA